MSRLPIRLFTCLFLILIAPALAWSALCPDALGRKRDSDLRSLVAAGSSDEVRLTAGRALEDAGFARVGLLSGPLEEDAVRSGAPGSHWAHAFTAICAAGDPEAVPFILDAVRKFSPAEIAWLENLPENFVDSMYRLIARLPFAEAMQMRRRLADLVLTLEESVEKAGRTPVRIVLNMAAAVDRHEPQRIRHIFSLHLLYGRREDAAVLAVAAQDTVNELAGRPIARILAQTRFPHMEDIHLALLTALAARLEEQGPAYVPSPLLIAAVKISRSQNFSAPIRARAVEVEQILDSKLPQPARG